ncbi:hypothetical protein RRG08_050593 [Elysia crispata]|uniref:WxxW domain-containing protein n=1 Tax=Elysia crispata TaxID=231223 RepID=A0AAE0Z8M0_9GAST|nr:hypothetical protein RRG08_050593 [Elysia crispata]
MTIANQNTDMRSSTRWSSWFDVEPSRGVENQSLSLIREIFHYDCSYRDIIKAQCRKVEAGTFPELYPDGGVFSQSYWHDDEFLRVPCDRSGIVCVDSDQAWARTQADRARTVPGGTDTESTDSNHVDSSSSWPLLSQEMTPDSGSSDINSSSRQAPVQNGAEKEWRSTCSDYEIRFLCGHTEGCGPFFSMFCASFPPHCSFAPEQKN